MLVAAAVDRAAHDALLATAIDAHNGTIVERGHDHAVMATFASAADAVGAAVALQQAGHEHDVELRVGVSVGDVGTEQDGVIVGGAVVEASRLCAAAQPTEILTAQTVRELALGRGGFTYEPMGDLVLGDLPDPVAACRVQWEPLPGPTASVPFPRALAGGFTTPYVGRTALLDPSGRRGAAAQAGTPGAVLLAGEPGVGKTRTAAEAGAARPRPTAPSSSTAAATKAWARRTSRSSRRSTGTRAHATPVGTLGRLPGELIRLLPDLGRPRRRTCPRRSPATPAPRSTGCSRRPRRGSSTRPETTGLLLVLDDVHWATKPTLLLTLHVLRAASASVCAGCSCSSPTATPTSTGPTRSSTLLGDLRRLPAVERAPVDNLTEAEVVALMEASAGHAMDEAGRALGRRGVRRDRGQPVLRRRGPAPPDRDRCDPPDGRPLGATADIGHARHSRRCPRRRGPPAVAPVGPRANDVLSPGVGARPRGSMSTCWSRSAMTARCGARRARRSGAGPTGRGDRCRPLPLLPRARAHHAVRGVVGDAPPPVAPPHRRCAREAATVDDVVALAYHCAEGGPDGGDFGRAVHYGLAAAEQSLAARAFADAEDRFRRSARVARGRRRRVDPRATSRRAGAASASANATRATRSSARRCSTRRGEPLDVGRHRICSCAPCSPTAAAWPASSARSTTSASS